jgi:O-acetyl-ADP-ribose deacetylase (regulator of RNase III)
MIHYLVGDATSPQVEGKKMIVHVCNNVGAWGAGFVLALSRKWREPEARYRSLPKYTLGEVDFVSVEVNISVANMIAQTLEREYVNGEIPLQYDALKECLKTVNQVAAYSNSTVHMPRIGCGLAGGDWNKVEAIINETLTVDVYVYDLK